jgi:RNA polymerase sigma factor (sigma-70 family)
VIERTQWSLNREAFDALLDALNPDREAASREYEALRRRLIDLFAWERFTAAEQLADETLNRLARRLAAGEPIESPRKFAHGIARMVMLEASREEQKRSAALREFQMTGGASESTQESVDALEDCLRQLPAEQRRIIEAYYSGDRDRLAESLGVSMNALRNRTMRIREKLFDCVTRKRDIS